MLLSSCIKILYYDSDKPHYTKDIPSSHGYRMNALGYGMEVTCNAEYLIDTDTMFHVFYISYSLIINPDIPDSTLLYNNTVGVATVACQLQCSLAHAPI